MEELEALIQFTTKEKIPLDFIFKKKNNLFHLYNIVYKHPNILLRQRLDIAFPNFPINTRYKLIRRLKTLLYDKILAFDFPQKERSNYSKSFHIVNKNWSTITFLSANSQPKLAEYLAKRTLKIALQYEFVDLVVELSKHIVIKSQLLSGKKKEYKKYHEIMVKHQKYQNELYDINLWYGEIAYLYKSSKGGKTTELIIKLVEYCAKIQKIQKVNNQYLYNIPAFIIFSTLHILNEDYEKAQLNANKALNYLKSKPFSNEKHVRSFQSDLVISYILTGKHEEAEKIARNNLLLTEKGSYNYFIIQSYRFNNSMLSRSYNNLPELCVEALKHKTIMSNPFKKELWDIRMAYVNLLYKLGIIETDLKKVVNFRIGRLVNDVPIFNKDKQGLHTSILILELLFLILNKKEDDAINRLDRLRVYTSKYHKGKSQKRNKLFFNMLIILISKSNFHPVRADYLTSYYRKKLAQTSYGLIQFEQEVIPYENLWEFIIILLNKNNT